VTSARHRAHEQDPLPLAVFDQQCAFRRTGIERLDRVGRRHRIAYTSASIAGIYAALDAGLAVSILLRSNLRPGLRALSEAEGFPALPDSGIMLLRAVPEPNPLLDRLEEHILESFRGSPNLSVAA
jgi:DNA-binding transcriptional LysR family regulator